MQSSTAIGSEDRINLLLFFTPHMMLVQRGTNSERPTPIERTQTESGTVMKGIAPAW